MTIRRIILAATAAFGTFVGGLRHLTTEGISVR
jgi:hypothetical protein